MKGLQRGAFLWCREVKARFDYRWKQVVTGVMVSVWAALGIALDCENVLNGDRHTKSYVPGIV